MLSIKHITTAGCVIITMLMILPSAAKADDFMEKIKAERVKTRAFLVELGATKEEAAKIVPKDEDCAVCHLDQFKEWAQDAPHYQGISFARVAYNHFVRDMKANGLKTDHKVMASCDRCHAPTLQRYGSEKLYVAITNIIGEDTEDAKVKANEKITALRSIGVGCIECHTAQMTGGSQEGPRYGTKKDAKSPHGTEYAPDMAKSEFCGKCHAINAKDTEAIRGAKIGKTQLIWCALNYDDWKLGGSKQQCQDCHMEKTGSRHNHSFPGSNNAEFLKKAVDISISGMRLSAETAGVKVTVHSNAGHIFPEGCILLADVVLSLTVKDETGKTVLSTERTWYSQSNGFLPLVFSPELKEVQRTPAVWTVNDYIRSFAVQMGDNIVDTSFYIAAGTKKLTVEAAMGYRQKDKTVPMTKVTNEITL
jgi:Cytochrome c554 and c-prime